LDIQPKKFERCLPVMILARFLASPQSRLGLGGSDLGVDGSLFGRACRDPKSSVEHGEPRELARPCVLEPISHSARSSLALARSSSTGRPERKLYGFEASCP
jgi:hypothetical protein